MKYYVEQKFWSLKDRFNIFDAEGNVAYYVEGEFFTIGKKFHIYDRYDQEVAFIKQEVWTFLPRFDIFVDGNNVGQIVKQFTFFTNKYVIEGSSWEINGNFLAHDYTITNGNEVVAEINKEWFTFVDKYEIDANEQYDPIIVVATVLAIDACLQAASASASATSSGAN